MYDDMKIHGLLIPQTQLRTCITNDGNSDDFIEFLFTVVRGKNNEIVLPNTSPRHFLSKKQAEELIKDLQGKIEKL